MVKIITWDNTNGAEPKDCYRLDQPGEGERFFKNLMTNADPDPEGQNVFAIKEVSDGVWSEILKLSVGLE